MARVVAFVPDLLFGSRVLAAILESGHEPVLAGGAVALEADLPGAGGVIVDLTAEATERTELVARLRAPGLPVLAFYAHVEADVRRGAEAAGFELIVPRSRMAREGAALVARLLASGAPADSP